MSTGFATLASAGRTARSAASVSGESAGSSKPAASQASAQRIPSPPAFVSTATRRPGGTGCVERRARDVDQLLERARPNDAGLVEERIDCASEPASAAVCELAAAHRSPSCRS